MNALHPSSRYLLSEPPTYVIHDRPIDRIPLHRLQSEGPDVLNVNELLHLALGEADGFPERVQEYGAAFLTTLHTLDDVMETLKLDRVQASRVLAILTLGRRLFTTGQGSLVTIRGAEDVFTHYRSMATLAREQLRVLLINSRYQLVHEEVLAIGGTEALNVSGRDVFQPAVERRVSAIVLVHNHPSGDPTPSESDLEFTVRMQEAGEILGIELLDHVIIGSAAYASCMHTGPSTLLPEA